MKKLLFAVAILVVTSVSAQSYISVSGGYAIGSSGVLMGTSLSADQSTAENHYGSFGEGLNTQLRLGHFFNDTFGVEVGFGYLQGADQVKDSYVYDAATKMVTEVVDAKAYGRAYGLSVALIYNFNENIYGKFGAVTKLGGRTGVEFTRTNATPLGLDIVTKGEQDFHGRPPLGFTGALGYKYKISDRINLFAELEYLGMNVTRDNSEFTSLTIDLPAIPANALGAGHPGFPADRWTLGDAPLVHPVFGTFYAPTKTDYVDSLPVDNSDITQTLSETVPYSSFGINFGITYSFGKSSK